MVAVVVKNLNREPLPDSLKLVKTTCADSRVQGLTQPEIIINPELPVHRVATDLWPIFFSGANQGLRKADLPVKAQQPWHSQPWSIDSVSLFWGIGQSSGVVDNLYHFGIFWRPCSSTAVALLSGVDLWCLWERRGKPVSHWTSWWLVFTYSSFKLCFRETASNLVIHF